MRLTNKKYRYKIANKHEKTASFILLISFFLTVPAFLQAKNPVNSTTAIYYSSLEGDRSGFELSPSVVAANVVSDASSVDNSKKQIDFDDTKKLYLDKFFYWSGLIAWVCFALFIICMSCVSCRDNKALSDDKEKLSS